MNGRNQMEIGILLLQCLLAVHMWADLSKLGLVYLDKAIALLFGKLNICQRISFNRFPKTKTILRRFNIPKSTYKNIVTKPSLHICFYLLQEQFLYIACASCNLSLFQKQLLLEFGIVFNKLPHFITQWLSNLQFPIHDDRIICNFFKDIVTPPRNMTSITIKKPPIPPQMPLPPIVPYFIQQDDNSEFIRDTIDATSLLSSCDMTLLDFSKIQHLF